MKISTQISKKLMLSILLSSLAISGFAADIPLTGQGTEASPYIIASASDLKQIVAYMHANNATLQGTYINLTSDIDLTGSEFAPISEFNGNFDGQGHTIKGISYTTTASYQGVFTTIGTEATVKNLTLKGAITSANSYTGGFAGILKGRIENCVNQIDVTSSNTNTAGFAAKAMSGANLIKCVNEAEITSSMANLAGVVANSERGVSYTECGNNGVIHNTGVGSYTAGVTAVALPSSFNGCYNTGEIIIDKPTSVDCVAGILSWANNVANAPTKVFTFTDCYNTAYINASDKVAGILAEITFSMTVTVSFEMNKCYNTGAIIASGNPSGNIGTAGISCFYAPGSKFIECYNTGIVQAEKKPYCAGIVGHYKVITSNTPEATTFDGCYNTGNVTATAGQGSGILAYCHKNVTIKNCYNTGNITGKSTMGGLLSTMASGSEIHNCWNTGDVTTEAETAAGIVANNANQCLITGCFNAGNITSKSSRTAGGIAGTCGSALVDCINLGKVKGLQEVGGLVGATRKGCTSFTRCYNAATVEAPDNVCGGLIGVSTANTGYWDEDNKVTDSYYATGFNDFSIPQAGNAISMAELVKLDLGDTWTRIAENCMPIMKQYADNEAAKVNSAAVLPKANETFDKIISDMNLGMPQDITWTSSSPVIKINGSTAQTVNPETPTEVILTASSDKFTRHWLLTVYPEGSTGINDLTNDVETIVSRTYFNTAGQTVPAPTCADGRIYIIKETTAEGKCQTRKMINR